MKYQRAQEIINSSKNINVSYKGNLVWINELNPDERTAVVSFLSSQGGFDNSIGREENTVTIDQLTELSNL